jgi:hypothetical protein
MACLGGRVTPRAQAKRFHVLAMLLVKVSWRRTLLRLFFCESTFCFKKVRNQSQAVSSVGQQVECPAVRFIADIASPRVDVS